MSGEGRGVKEGGQGTVQHTWNPQVEDLTPSTQYTQRGDGRRSHPKNVCPYTE